MKTIISAIALVVLVLGIAQQAMATLNSNSIVEDGIEYYIQTDKSVYDLGENVEMLYRVTNLGIENATFDFTSGPVDDRCDYIVEKDGERIWDNLVRPRARVITYLTLSPLESKEFTMPWNMTDFGGHQVVPGSYDVTGVLGDLWFAYPERYVPVSVSIEIIPEPASLLLFGAGLFGLLARNRTSHKK
jgi:hypothetical protein